MRLLFGPEGWASLGPFDFQISRFLLYFGYFILGTIVGTIPLDKGLLSDQSSFMRNWLLFILLSLSAFCLLLLIDNPLKRLVQAERISSFSSNLIYCSIFVSSCIFSCAAYLTTAKAYFQAKEDILGYYYLQFVHYLSYTLCIHNLGTIYFIESSFAGHL